MNILIFGATGTAGGCVLRACLNAPEVKEVRLVTRHSVGLQNDKLQEFLHHDFLNYESIADAFADIDACLFCLGVSVLQVPDETQYRRITHDFTMAAAQQLKKASPKAVFHYISGQGTRPGSRVMWSRVKGQTEQELIALMRSAGWRPAMIGGKPSAHSPKLLKILHPVLRMLKPFRGLYVDGLDLGCAMIQATMEGVHGRVIENVEIREIAERYLGRAVK